MNAADVVSDGAGKAIKVKRDHQANARFIASTTDNLLKVDKISQYVPKKLTPSNGAGMWVAISHEAFLPAAQTLEKHRANLPGTTPWNQPMSTVVLNVQDVINQAGYGFGTPMAITDFLRYAYLNWNEPPQYVTFFGDATVNPRQLDCANCGKNWDKSRPTYVPTDMSFADRVIGMIPTDFTYGLLTGDDLFSEIAVSRIPSETIVEANDIVKKIIDYENRFASSKPTDAPWFSMPFLFVADNPDTGGNFCAESMVAGQHTPTIVEKDYLCVPSEKELQDSGQTLEQATAQLRKDMFGMINDSKRPLSMFNYRGHGSVTQWARPAIMSTDAKYIDGWQNYGDPLVLLSADCLDGHFAKTDVTGLGETVLKLKNKGSAAHWASVGYGYTFEHSHLHNRFYDAIFSAGVGTLGGAVKFSKNSYVDAGFDDSEAYGFALLGDAGMMVYPWYPTINVPVVLSP
jgi:hypothetical protein